MDEMKKEFIKASEILKSIAEISFKEFEKDPTKKNDIVALWQQTISEFFQYTSTASEKYNGKELYKAITRSMIFGK
ncbi:MAG: hypothetical protein ACPL3A_00295 [Thermoanaerobacteraceae bacterium]